MTDAGGLVIEIAASGSKLWRYRYKIDGKERMLALGAYPEVSLSEAREARDAARAIVQAGRDPNLDRRLRRVEATTNRENTFAAIAADWVQQNKPRWVAAHYDDVAGSLERLVYPKIGSLPIGEITAPMVLTVLRDIEARPAIETAHRVRQRISAVFVHAIAGGLVTTDPAAIVKPALAPVVRGRQPAITNLEEVREVLRRSEAVPAHPATRLALRLLALTAVRPGEVIRATSGEFREMASGLEWTIPAERMKMKREHVVPLSRQASEVLVLARDIAGRSPWLFPSTRSAAHPMSSNALGYLINRAGYHHRHVPHGWRAAFSSIMNERRPRDRGIIDLMLAHVNKNEVEAAYNRAQHLDLRREIAQEWADLLLMDALPASALMTLPRK